MMKMRMERNFPVVERKFPGEKPSHEDLCGFRMSICIGMIVALL